MLLSSTYPFHVPFSYLPFHVPFSYISFQCFSLLTFFPFLSPSFLSIPLSYISFPRSFYLDILSMFLSPTTLLFILLSYFPFHAPISYISIRCSFFQPTFLSMFLSLTYPFHVPLSYLPFMFLSLTYPFHVPLSFLSMFLSPTYPLHASLSYLPFHVPLSFILIIDRNHNLMLPLFSFFFLIFTTPLPFVWSYQPYKIFCFSGYEDFNSCSCFFSTLGTILVKVIMQGKLIAVAYFLCKYSNQFSMGRISKQE